MVNCGKTQRQTLSIYQIEEMKIISTKLSFSGLNNLQTDAVPPRHDDDVHIVPGKICE